MTTVGASNSGEIRYCASIPLVDPELAYELVELLQGINACGTTILMVTHSHEMVRHFGGRIINISEGEVVFDEVIGGAEVEAQ